MAARDRADSRGLRLVGHADLGGRGDCMQIMRNGRYLYVGHMGDFGIGTSVIDVADPAAPKVVRQIPVPPGTHAHKTQLGDGLLLVNHEQYPYRVGVPESHGLLVYDVSRPDDPRRIGFLELDGLGVHRIWYTGGRYAWMSARERPYRDRFLLVVDLADASRPAVASRWAFPGQREDEPWGYAPDAVVRAHHVVVRGDRAYGGYDDLGLVVYRVDGPRLELLSALSWAADAGGHPHTHTALPLHDGRIVVVTDEAIEPNCEGARKDVHVVDLSDERRPREIAKFPVPRGDWCRPNTRFGPHNLHENRPGTFRSDRLVFVTYFAAGLRVYDLADPARPEEVGAFVPPAPAGQAAIQVNDVLVDADGLVFVSDRVRGGVYILRADDALLARA